MAKRWKIEGMKELEKSLKKLGDVPQKHVTAASRKGMNIPLKAANEKAPVDTGELKSGIKLIGEKSKSKGKKVYRIVFDRAKNDVFQKKVKSPQSKSTANGTAYYPVSQEYGFFTKNGKYIPGYRFIHNPFEENYKKIRDTIVNEMGKKIDQAWKG